MNTLFVLAGQNVDFLWNSQRAKPAGDEDKAEGASEVDDEVLLMSLYLLQGNSTAV